MRATAAGYAAVTRGELRRALRRPAHGRPGELCCGSAPADELAKMVKHIPAGYVGELSDAVGAVRYLLSDAARYVNGANLTLSGGWGL